MRTHDQKQVLALNTGHKTVQSALAAKHIAGSCVVASQVILGSGSTLLRSLVLRTTDTGVQMIVELLDSP